MAAKTAKKTAKRGGSGRPFKKGQSGNPTGRPKGARGKLTVAAELAKVGITPLDYLLSVMRDENVAPRDRMDAAGKAAPYVHPRLNAVEHSGKVNASEAFVTLLKKVSNGAFDRRASR